MNHDEALGRLTKEASSLEGILRSIAALLIGDREVGDVVTYRVTMERLIEICQGLATLRLEDPTLTDFMEIFEDARRAKNRRNDLIHATWLQHGEVPRRMHLRRNKSKITMRIEPSSMKEIQEAADEIAHVSAQLVALMILQFPDFREQAMEALKDD